MRFSAVPFLLLGGAFAAPVQDTESLNGQSHTDGLVARALGSLQLRNPLPAFPMIRPPPVKPVAVPKPVAAPKPVTAPKPAGRPNGQTTHNTPDDTPGLRPEDAPPKQANDPANPENPQQKEPSLAEQLAQNPPPPPMFPGHQQDQGGGTNGPPGLRPAEG